MRRTLIVCFCLLAGVISTALAASELHINPVMPKTGTRITVTYKPGEHFKGAGKLYAILYSFNEPTTKAYASQFDLQYDKSSKSFTGDYKLSPETVYGMIRVSDGVNNYDDNEARYWDFYVTADGSKPMQGAYNRAAVSFVGNLPAQIHKKVDFKEAQVLMKKEIELYPQSIQAQIGLASLSYELAEIDKATYDKKMEELLASSYDKSKENYIRAVTRAQRAMNRGAEADVLEKEYVEKHPSSSIAEEVQLQALQQVKDPGEFVAKAKTFLLTFPTSDLNEEIQTVGMNALVSQSKLDEAEKFISEVRYPAAAAYNQLAAAYLGKDMSDKALALSDKAVELGRTPRMESKPSHLAEFEWHKQTQLTLGGILHTRAIILSKIKQRMPDAMQAYDESLRLFQDKAPVEVYESAVKIYEEGGRRKDALAVAAQAMEHSQANDFIREEHKQLYKQLMTGKSDADYAKVLDDINAAAKENRRRQLAEERLNMPAIEGSVQTLDGKKVSLSDFKGKVVVLDFWATWCGPCKSSFPSMQDLYNSYKDNKNIQFLVVNVWERDGDRKGVVDKFLGEKKYTFPVYLDLKDEVVKNFGVTGIPTKFYLDKQGRIQYKEVGYKSPEEFKTSANEIIQLMLNDDFYKAQ